MRDAVNESRLRPVEYVQTRYRIVAEQGTPIETVLKPTYYAHVARLLKPGDELLIIAEDNAWRLEAVVIDTGPLAAIVRELHRWVWAEEDVEADPKAIVGTNQPAYRRIWKGPHDMHCIERVEDGVIVQKQIRDKIEAEKIAANYAPKAA